MYRTKVGSLPNSIAGYINEKLHDPSLLRSGERRSILKGGLLVDPANKLEGAHDIAIVNDRVSEVQREIKPEKGDIVYDCTNMIVMPGIIDMHVHLGDLFEVTTMPIHSAARDGVTLGISPGAGNTMMAPSLLGAEMDRGIPLNVSLLIGATNLLGTRMSDDDWISYFNGTLDEEIAMAKMTRNRISYLTALLAIGIKDHMGHFIMPDESIERAFNISSKSNLLYMSHTQDPAHTERLVDISKGRPLHLGHATACGCGSHMDGEEAMKMIVDFCKKEHVSGEFVTTQLRKNRGRREGLKMSEKAQQVAFDALKDGVVNILISDGQCDATMKGFGDSRDNIPAILELAEAGILSLSDAVATMTCNPAKLLAKRNGNDWWTRETGHLGEGAYANVTVVDPYTKTAMYTLVNGAVVNFEQRNVRGGESAGGWVSRKGIIRRMGVGDLAMFSYVQ